MMGIKDDKLLCEPQPPKEKLLLQDLSLKSRKVIKARSRFERSFLPTANNKKEVEDRNNARGHLSW
jgi:hypothetical protein